MNKKAPSCIFEWKAAGDNDRSRYWDRKSILLWFLWDLTLKAPQLPRSSVQYGQKVKNRRHYGAAARRTTVAVNLKGVSDKQLAVIHRSIRNTWGTAGHRTYRVYWDCSCSLGPIAAGWFCFAPGHDLFASIPFNKMVGRNLKISRRRWRSKCAKVTRTDHNNNNNHFVIEGEWEVQLDVRSQRGGCSLKQSLVPPPVLTINQQPQSLLTSQLAQIYECTP